VRASARVVVLLGVLLGSAAYGVLGAHATAAQESPATTSVPPTTVPAPGPRIAGTLQAGTTPVAGVRITVEAVDVAAGPGFSARTESGADGTWSVVVPGPGTYRVAIDPATIPEGIALADPERSVLPRFPVFPGATVRNAVFELTSGDGGGRPGPPGRFDRLANLFVSGIRLGLIVGLASVGLSLVYGTTGLVNFAHGELVTLGGLLAWYLSTSAGGPGATLVAAAAIAVVLAGAFGGALELGLWRPMVRRRSGAVARMLVSIGLALFLRHLYQVLFGGNPRSYREYATQPPFEIGPLRFPASTWVVMVVCLLVLVAVGVVLERTRFGTAIRAVADERDLAEASGIDVRRVVLSVWVGATGLAALGGVLLGVTQAVQWNMGFRLLLTMFAAVVLGGLGSAYGAMAGGLVVGVASEVGTYWIDADFKFATALVILVLVLLVRPQGILGVRERIG
jgi:branched-chain amino acid transport system permease protein